MNIQVFSKLNSWEDFQIFLTSLNKKEKGNAFEQLTKFFFLLDPVHRTFYDEVWLFNEVPLKHLEQLGLPPQDLGIDLIARVGKEYHAIQCKYHTDSNTSVTFKEVATFLSLFEGNKKITKGYICSSADLTSKNFDKVRSEHISLVLSDTWNVLPIEFFDAIRSEMQNNITELVPFQPKPHQVKAINDAKHHFLVEKHDRGKLIFPCGAGKSLTGFWLSRELAAKSIVVAVPSLSLVKQTLDVYLREIVAHKKRVKWLCICSDEGIGKGDDIAIRTENIGVPCVTDPLYIANWLKENRQEEKIIFTTYQSGRILSEVSKSLKYTFDLGIFDEAHKTVGSDKKLFSHLLFDENIAIRKRLFMTATERFYAGSKNDIISMDNEDIYGDTFTQMSFKEAIEAELLTDYKVITIDVKKSEIAEFIRDNKLVELNGKWKKDTEARSLASMIALRKAMRIFPIRNAVSFHSSIEKAQRNKELQQFITDTYHYDPIDTYTVSGKMPTTKRNEIVREFAASSHALITNARCLTEGVDVPNIDCIVFSDPRKSKVDIVQALGRALRKKEGKDWGYVILPVIYDDATHEIDNENFQEILAIVRGLASNDERIVEYFRDKNDTKRKIQNQRDKQFQFEVFSEYIDASELTSQLQIKLWEKLSRFNWMPFEEAREYVRGLGLKNVNEWRINHQYLLKSMISIPLEPHSVYREKGWISYGDWLGTRRVANINREFLNFEEARQYTNTLNLKSAKEWSEYCKSGKKPDNIPADPKTSYKDSGWISFSDWLGTKPNFDGRYLVYTEAREYIQKLKLGNQKGWKAFVKSGMKPHNIPSNPNTVYKTSGWINLADWLGSSNRSNKDLQFLDFEKAKKFVYSLKLKSTTEWDNYKKSGSKPKFIPSSPATVYKKQGWKGIGDWLGTDRIANQNRDYLTFEKAREYIRSLELKSKNDWNTFLKSGKIPNKIPHSPDKIYKHLGWISWHDWIGIEEKDYLSYDSAEKIVQNFKFSRQKDWIEFTKSPKFPDNIPKYPEKYYKGKGWIDLGTWLGTRSVANSKKQFLTFQQAREFVRLLDLKSVAEWREFCNSGKKPSNIPRNPDSTYKKTGWVSYIDWLGTRNISTRNLNFLPFGEARKFIHTLNIKNELSWKEYCKSGKKPDDIPANPKAVYKDSGWKNLGDWLGTGRIAFGKIHYWEFETARDFVRTLYLKSNKEWTNYCNSGEKPNEIPKSPYYYYKSEWKGWADFLGKEE